AVLYALFLQQKEQLLAVLRPVLEQVAYDEDGPFQVAGDLPDLPYEELRRLEGGPFPAGHVLEREMRASAGLAVVSAAPAGEDCGNGILGPVDEGHIPGKVPVSRHLPYDVAVIRAGVVERLGHEGQGVDDHRSPVPVGKVRDVGERALPADGLHE